MTALSGQRYTALSPSLLKVLTTISNCGPVKTCAELP